MNGANINEVPLACQSLFSQKKFVCCFNDQLDEPFAAEDIEWRIQQSGKTRDGKVWAMVLAYVTNRAIMK
ncbi:hypothetical protein MJO10_29205, partial [Salmonella enterica subsp. enterica serovar Anatum]|nr:hypothetical protein [Salmonella enterica subsp. enterica serovar Anatum]